MAVDGVDQGVEIDAYSPTTGYGVADAYIHVDDGGRSHELTFTVPGKNPSSTGYTLAFDYIGFESYN